MEGTVEWVQNMPKDQFSYVGKPFDLREQLSEREITVNNNGQSSDPK